MANVLTTDLALGSIVEIDTANGVHQFLVDSGGGATSLVDLSNALYVDQQTTVPILSRTGNLEAPFGTLGAFVAAIAGAAIARTCIATSYDYSAEAPLVLPDVSVSIVDESLQGTGGAGRLVLPQITTVNRLQILTAMLAASLSAFNLELDNCEQTAGILTALHEFKAKDCAALLVTNCEDGEYENCRVRGDINCSGTTLQFFDCDFSAVLITFTAAPGLVTLDEVSYQDWIATGVHLVNGAIRVLGGFQNLSTNVIADATTAVFPDAQNGNIESPFDDINKALAVAGNNQVLCAPGLYGPNITVAADASVGALSANSDPVRYGITFPGALVVNAGIIFSMQKWTMSGAASLALVDAASRVIATGCLLRNVSGLGFLEMYDCNAAATAMVCGTINAARSALPVAVGLSGVIATFQDCDFSGGCVITFTGAPGVVHLRGRSWAAFSAAGGTVVNGTMIEDDTRLPNATIVINVPAVLAGSLDYVSTSLVGTPLAGRIIAAGQPVLVNPQADVGGAGGVGVGALVYAYADAPDSVRCAFIGGLAGGNQNFTVTVP